MVSSFCEVEGLCIAYERTAGSVFQIVVNNIMQCPHSKRKRKAQKLRKSSVSELFDLVTRTGIENLGALFVTCRDMQKSPKIRHFRTINKSPFILFFAKFLHS